MTMRHITGSTFALFAALALGAPAFFGCEKKAETPAHDSHSHEGHDHSHGDDHAHGDDHGHGPTVQLGVQTIGAFSVKASRDGELTPGADVPVDVWITGAAKVGAVRFWIGSQDGKGSIKAKAELEKDNWHTHVEAPTPLPEDAKLWVEIETDGGETATGGFDLNVKPASP